MVITQRPVEADVFSFRSIQFAKDSLATCMKYHKQCRSEWLKADLLRERQDLHSLEQLNLAREIIALEDLPTRLLRITSNAECSSLTVRLVEVAKATAPEQMQVANAGFATLSYCWGKGGNPIQLTLQTYEIILTGLQASSLPATIRDAIRCAWAVGIEYIWVDALCIFQDNQQDKEFEITRMGSYYGTNSLTLCAASADSSSQGLREAKPESLYKCPPISLACRVGGGFGRILLHSRPDVKEPITERGWTLQESLLSRRILIFSHQLYWCCVTANAECEGAMHVLSKEPNRNFGSPESLVQGVYPAQVLRDYPPETQWFLVVSDYLTRRLGVGSDKLLAISAFASWVHARFRVCGSARDDRRPRARSPGESVSYAAGLFLSPYDSSMTTVQLFWLPVRTSDCARPKKYRAPSWSWAAINGDLKLCEPGIGSGSILKHLDIQLSNPSSPYGSVQSATLQLADCQMQPLQGFLKRHARIVDAADTPNTYGMSILPDTLDDAHFIRCVLESASATSIFLLKLNEGSKIRLDKSRSGAERLKTCNCFGLVLTSAPGALFRRIGTFDLDFVIREDETELESMLKDFFDSKGQDVTLI